MSPASSADAGESRPPSLPLADPPQAAAPDGAPGRMHFQAQLRALEEHALGGLDLIVEQLDRVLEALEHQDVELAQMVIADDDRVDGRYLEVHQGILSLLALQAPGLAEHLPPLRLRSPSARTAPSPDRRATSDCESIRRRAKALFRR